MTVGFFFPAMNEAKLKGRGETQTRRHSFDLREQRVADCSREPDMWNHFSRCRRREEFSVWPNPSGETKASSSLHRFPPRRFVAPGVRRLSGRDELQIRASSKDTFKQERNPQENIGQKFLRALSKFSQVLYETLLFLSWAFFFFF